MSNLLSRITEGATCGGLLGGAIGTLFAGAILALPGINIVLAPVAAAAATTITVSGSAAGTLLGGVAGAVGGSDKSDNNKEVDI